MSESATKSLSIPVQEQTRWRTRYGPWALVTGASDGIGRAMAHALAQAGLNLVLVARRGALLESLGAAWSGQYGIDVRSLAADLAEESEVESVFRAVDDLEIGLLVACAGFGTSGQLIEADLQQELTLLDLNCRAVLQMSHHFGRRFAAQGRGGLVLMSSLLAFQGVPRAANYAASKAYIQTLAEGLHAELNPLGVDVLASAPGPIHSGFAARANMQMGMAAQPEEIALATLTALGRKTTVRPGWLSKFLIGSLSLLPRDARIQAMARIMQGMTRHQAA
jgi:hypothetical protein